MVVITRVWGLCTNRGRALKLTRVSFKGVAHNTLSTTAKYKIQNVILIIDLWQDNVKFFQVTGVRFSHSYFNIKWRQNEIFLTGWHRRIILLNFMKYFEKHFCRILSTLIVSYIRNFNGNRLSRCNLTCVTKSSITSH